VHLTAARTRYRAAHAVEGAERFVRSESRSEVSGTTQLSGG